MSTLDLIKVIVFTAVIVLLITYYTIKALRNGWITQIKDAIINACKQAEKQYPSGHGVEKRAYVLSQVKSTCEKYGIPYKFIEALIIKVVEQIISNYNGMTK